MKKYLSLFVLFALFFCISDIDINKQSGVTLWLIWVSADDDTEENEDAEQEEVEEDAEQNEDVEQKEVEQEESNEKEVEIKEEEVEQEELEPVESNENELEEKEVEEKEEVQEEQNEELEEKEQVKEAEKEEIDEEIKKEIVDEEKEEEIIQEKEIEEKEKKLEENENKEVEKKEEVQEEQNEEVEEQEKEQEKEVEIEEREKINFDESETEDNNEVDEDDTEIKEVFEKNHENTKNINKKIIEKYSDEPTKKEINKSNILPNKIRFQPISVLAKKEYYVKLWNRIFFDTYQSSVNNDTKIYWDFWDGKFIKNKKSTSHLFKKPGVYSVTLKLVNGTNNSIATASVIVSQNTIIALTDNSVSDEEINKLKVAAKKQNAFLKILPIQNEWNSFELEEKMTQALAAEVEILENADYFLALTAWWVWINAYQRALHANSIKTNNKKIISLSSHESDNWLITKSIEKNLNDEFDSVLFASLDDANEIFSEKPEWIEKKLEEKNIEFTEAKKQNIVFIHPGNFLSHIVSYLLWKDIAHNIILLILMLPVAATVVVFFRQIIGITSFGIFTPALLAVTFLATGLSYGLLMFFVILIAGWLLRWAIQNVKLLSVPRISIVMIFVSFIMLLLLGVWVYFEKAFVYSIWAFPMLILAFVIEKYVTSHIEKGMKEAMILLFSTLFIAIISYFVMNWLWMQTLLIAYPEIIFALVVINVLLGKWTGMRLVEYLRFKVLINKISE